MPRYAKLLQRPMQLFCELSMTSQSLNLRDLLVLLSIHSLQFCWTFTIYQMSSWSLSWALMVFIRYSSHTCMLVWAACPDRLRLHSRNVLVPTIWETWSAYKNDPWVLLDRVVVVAFMCVIDAGLFPIRTWDNMPWIAWSRHSSDLLCQYSLPAFVFLYSDCINPDKLCTHDHVAA